MRLLKLSALGLTLVCIAPAYGQIDPQKIDIVRDRYGVPHIFAKTDAEVVYGLEWATCEDDFETPQWLLLAAKSLLGLHLGPDGAQVDYVVQLTRVREFVENNYEKDIPDNYKKLLEAGAAAVNRYAELHPEEVLVKRAFPVTPQDFIVGYMLGQGLMSGLDGTVRSIIDGGVLNDLPERVDNGIGSNAYAISPKLSADGQTFHVINSHQPITGLLSWYEAHLHSEEGWNIHGSTFHGGMSIFHGTNRHLSWAHTTGDLDLSDTYQLVMHPKKKNMYRFDGQWKKLESFRAKLRVALGKKKGFKITIGKKYWRSIYGPTLVTKHGTFAFRMPALMEMKAPVQWYAMNHATNFDEFYKALKIQGIVMQNITYADKDGNIFFIANGKVPRRNPKYNWRKVLPGDTSATLWTEYFGVDELEQKKNPECGYVFNTNNSIFENSCETSDHTPYPVCIGYEPGKMNNRGNRSLEVLNSRSTFTYDQVKALKFDVQFPDSVVFLKNYPIMDLMRVNPDRYPDVADCLRKIQHWKHRTDSTDRDFGIILYTMYNLYEDNSIKEKELRENDTLRLSFLIRHLRAAKEHMMKTFGTIDIELGKVQVLTRGDKTYAINGGPDNIRAVYGRKLPDGRMEMWLGDSYVQMVRFGKDGPVIESVNAYGASNKPKNAHYNDQMGLFVNEKFKPQSLDKETVYKNAERVYHPQ
jgi:acyl-homoserine-lactone acylase